MNATKNKAEKYPARNIFPLNEFTSLPPENKPVGLSSTGFSHLGSYRLIMPLVNRLC